jgi:hypothetical protein
MNAQQQKEQLKAGWLNWIISAILWAIDHYGDDVLAIVKERITNEQIERGINPCPSGYSPDGKGGCQKDPG